MTTKKTIKLDRLTRTAYHEAGHAVMHVLRKVPFKYVTIVPGEGDLGHLLQAKLTQGLLEDIEAGIWEHRTFKRLEAGIDVSLAGYEAVRRAGVRNPSKGCEADFDTVGGLAIRLQEDLADAYIVWRTACVRNLIDFHWNKVEAVTRALLEKKRLTARHVREICCPLTPTSVVLVES